MPPKRRAASKAKTRLNHAKKRAREDDRQRDLETIKYQLEYQLYDAEIELDKRIAALHASARHQAQKIRNQLGVVLITLPKDVREMPIDDFLGGEPQAQRQRALTDATNTATKRNGAGFASTVIKNKPTSTRVGRTLGTIKKSKQNTSRIQQQPKTPSLKTMKSAKTPAFHPGLPKTPATSKNGVSRRATVRATLGADESGEAAIIEFERADGSKFNLCDDPSTLSREERENALAQIDYLKNQLETAAKGLQ